MVRAIGEQIEQASARILLHLAKDFPLPIEPGADRYDLSAHRPQRFKRGTIPCP
jgi:hypothetical protein